MKIFKIRKLKKYGTSYFITSICTIAITLFVSLKYKEVASATEDMYVETFIANAITVTKTRDLLFGNIQPPTSGSVDVVIRPASGDIIYSCPTDAICQGTVQRGQFRTQGSPDEYFDVTYGDGVLSDGETTPNTIQLDISDASLGHTSSLTFRSSDGKRWISFGGILTIPSTLPNGTYTTTNSGATPITITVTYQ